MTLPTCYSWFPIGEVLRIPYEAPQGRRVNAIGAYFSHGLMAGHFLFETYAALPKSRAKKPRKTKEQIAADHGLTPGEVGPIDSTRFLDFVWRVAGRPEVYTTDWKRERPLWMVLDNYSVHTGQAVAEAIPGLEAAHVFFFYLPSYSPELSEIEPIWHAVKHHEIPVRSHSQVKDLKAAVDTALTRKAQDLRVAQQESTNQLRAPAYAQIDAATPTPPCVRDVWLEGIQVMAAREREASDQRLYVAVKGGHNGESHNHNDVGHFLVYCDAEPALIDLGVETYTAKTFSPQRYEIWTMQSAYHNLPTVGGVQQAAGEEFAAREVVWESDDSHAQLSLDIAHAYPSEAGIEEWHRTVSLERGVEPAVLLHECFRLTAPSEVTLSLMTPRAPELPEPDRILLPGKCTLCLEYPMELSAAVEEIEVTDPRLQAVWGTRLFRLLLQTHGPVSSGEWQLCCKRYSSAVVGV
jgi:hypothetical protein